MLVLLTLMAGASGTPTPQTEYCDSGGTIGMALCMDKKIEQATTQLNVYRGRAIRRFREDERPADPATAKAIEAAGTASDAARSIYCDAVNQRWIEGSIRYAMSQTCTLRLIDRETHDIWRDFLGYIQDDEKPLLPEPKPSE